MTDNLIRKRELERRTMLFAVSVFQVLRKLPRTIDSQVISHQIGKSASSIGANYREANRSESRVDFTHKIGIVLKEASETGYWLEVLSELYPKSELIVNLSQECDELIRIFQSVNRTARTKSKQLLNQSTNRRIE